MDNENLAYWVLGGCLGLYILAGIGIHKFNRYKRDGSIRNLTNLPNPEKITNPDDESKLAIIVKGSYFSSDLKIQNEDLVTALFRQLGYHTIFINHQTADEGTIRESLNQKSITSSKESQTIIYFTGHGNIPVDGLEGILLKGETQVIGPQQLFSMVSPIRGKKLVMFDCCNSGIFTDYLKTEEGRRSLRDYVVIGACPAGKVTNRGHRGYDGCIGQLTYGFFQMLEENKGRPIDMATVDIKAGTALARLLHRLFGWREKDFSYEVQRVSDTSYLL